MLSDWTLERAGRSSEISKAPETVVSDTSNVRDDREEAEKKAEMHCEELMMMQGNCNANKAIVHPEDTSRAQTAALLVIGDEILIGFTVDSNLSVTANALAKIGIPLKKVSIVSDEIDEIAQEIQRLSQRYDIVFTSGGIGPTHDDVTITAIAKALQQEIRLSAEMLQHLETVHSEQWQQQHHHNHHHFVLGTESNSSSIAPMGESMRRMAFLPEQSLLRFPPHPDDYYFTTREVASSSSTDQPMALQSVVTQQHKTWPILQCDNIFILPGVPQFFAAKMQLITKYFLLKQEVQERWKIILDVEERALVQELDIIVAAFPHVKIGSYPYVEHPEFKTILTVEAAQVTEVEAAVQALITALPAQAVLRVERVLPASVSSEAHTPKETK
jgi:FAD synthetase